MKSSVLQKPRQPLAGIYWRATRAFSFPASVVSLLLGTTLAAVSGGNGLRFHLAAFLLVMLGGILAHAGANVFNDYFDFVKGVDTRPEHGSGVLTSGLLTPREMRWFGMLLMVGAAFCGLMLLAMRSPQIAFEGIAGLALLGFACALLYPMFLKRYGLGDVLIVLSFGLGMPLGAFVAQADVLDARHILFVLIASLPSASLIDAILHANNMRDSQDDRAAGVRTLATLLTESGSRRLQAALLLFPIGFVLIGVLTRWLPPISLLALLSIPLLRRAYQQGAVPLVAMCHLAFGVPYALAFLCSAQVIP